jgi:transposase
MESRRYPTDLSDDEWRCIDPHLPGPTGRGRPRLHSLRAILNAVFYVLKSSCPWQLLPRDFPPWKTVYDWFRRWRIDGTFERLNAALRRRLRMLAGRNTRPSAGIADSQSAKTTGVGGEQRGYNVEYVRGTDRFEEVGRPRLYETPHAPRQPKLFRLDTLGETGWLKALKLEGYASRHPRRSLALQEALFPYLVALA